MCPLRTRFVDPSCVDAGLMVVLDGRKATVFDFTDGWVFDVGLHFVGLLSQWSMFIMVNHDLFKVKHKLC